MLPYYSSIYFFDKKKDELIASFFSNDQDKFEDIYRKIYTKLCDCNSLDENSQKILNQIQVFFSTYKNQLKNSNLLELNHKIKKHLASIVRSETKLPSMVSFEAWQKKTCLTPKCLAILYKTTIVFQISSGCSNYCRRCNEWALPGVRKHFDFNAVKHFTTEFFNSGNKDFIYYGASDPLDWEDSKHSINTLIDFLSDNQLTPSYGLLTKLPIGKQKELEKLIQKNADFSISQTNKNRRRVRAIENKTGTTMLKQHDDVELMIPSGLDEDFKTVKSSINDSYGTEITPDGAYMVIPAFTSILNLTGQKRIPISENTNYFLINKTGRKALSVTYFKPLEAVNLKGEIFRLNHLLDVQIENILLDNGSDTLNPPGMMTLDEFFKTFETDAVLRKKKILPSIISELRIRHLKNKRYRGTSPKHKKLYRKQLSDYLILCNEKKMKCLIKYSVSFFLKAVSDYLTKEPVKRLLIIHLKKTDKLTLEKKYKVEFNSKNIETFFDISRMNPFDLFQILTIRLILNPKDPDIIGFIEKHPAVFDEGTGLFIKKFTD